METKRNHPMLDPEDLKWLATSATELNRLLQETARKAEQARLRKGDGGHLESLGEELKRASRASKAIFDRITTRSFASVDGGSQSDESTPMSGGPANISAEISAPELAVMSDTESDSLINNPKGERELILLVDDDQEILERAGEILDFEDYRFVLAKDGIEALQIYRRMFKNIDLVLLDYFLPVMDGDAVFDELKAINPNARVVLSSGFGEHARVRRMLSRGLSGFIPKPYTHEKLVEQIRSILEA